MAEQLTPEQRKVIMVNYLPSTVDQAQLKEMFSEFGTITKVYLVMNPLTNESKGYGFINYAEEESSQKAIDKLNRTKMDNKTLRVAYSTPIDGSKVYTKQVVDDVNVYIAGIPKDWKEPDLAERFSQFGPLKHVKIMRDSSNESRGAGFVKYGTSREASAAILNMDGKVPDGGKLPLVVKIADTPKKTSNASLKLVTKAGGGVVSMHDQRFSPYGKQPTAPAGVPPPTATHPPYPGGYPSASYPPMPNSTHPQASHDQTPPPGHMPPSYPPYQGYQPPMHYPPPPTAATPHPSTVHTAAPGNAPSGNYCLYVANLPETSCKNCLLYQLFAPFGAIASVKPMNNVNGHEHGDDHWFGFINFKNYNDAYAAIHAMNGSTLNGRSLKVDFKAEKKK